MKEKMIKLRSRKQKKINPMVDGFWYPVGSADM